MNVAGEPTPEADASDPASIRRANGRDEAYVKALSILNILDAILVFALVIPYVPYAVMHWRRQINAPWSVWPARLAYNILGVIVIVVTLTAGMGLRRFRSWALRLEILFAAGLLVMLGLAIVASSRELGIGEMAGMALVVASLLTPFLNVPDLRDSPVFKPEYRQVIAATRRTVRVRPRLPRALKILAVVLGSIGLLLLVYSAEE